MDIIQELYKQEDAIRVNGHTPKYISFSLSGFGELLRWMHLQSFGSIESTPSNVSLLWGYPILVNPKQKGLVIVLVGAMEEFLYKDKIRTEWVADE